MAVMEKISNSGVSPETPAKDSGNVLDRVTAILGYDLPETQAIENDGDLYARAIARLGTGETVAAGDVFGSATTE
jgi:hypothetical protein